MFKLYRITNKYEYEKLKNGILSFKLKNKEIRNTRFNTFDYGKNENSDNAYKKHFFLTKEDANTFRKKTDSPDMISSVFYIPEELVYKNIGIGNYGSGFYPLEVAISSSEFKETFNMQSLPCVNPKEFLSIEGSTLIIEEEFLDSEFSEEFYSYECIMCDILKKYLNEQNILLIKDVKKYFDSEQNRKEITKELKRIYNY